MSLTKLDHEQTLLLSKKLEKINTLHQEAIAKEAVAYQYDWVSLDRSITQAILEYTHILNTTECVGK